MTNDFDLDYDYAPAGADNKSSASSNAAAPVATPAPAADIGGPVPMKRVRAIITNAAGQFLAQVNNRVTLGSLTVMVPGGDIRAEENELTALARHIRDELGMTMELCPSNCRFLINRAYEFQSGMSGSDRASINFYEVVSDGAVPRNMDDSVLSVTWMTPGDLRRYLDLDAGNWKVKLGALDAVDMALDPSKARRVDGARELSRQDGGKAPGGDQASRPSRLPYGQ